MKPKENPDFNIWTKLPIELKLKILRMIPSQQQWELRLVSTDFCHVVNILRNKSIIGTLSNDSLRLVTNCSFGTIEKLKVQDLTSDLKLYSSSRCVIPGTNHLVICDGISQENMLKLFIHYCHNVSMLTLNPTCFSNLSTKAMKLKYLKGLNNIECLNITTWPVLNTRGYNREFGGAMRPRQIKKLIDKLKNHRFVMKYFLNTNFQNLQTVNLNMYKENDQYGRVLKRNQLQFQNNMTKIKQIRSLWNDNLHLFFKKNGENIKSLNISLAHENIPILTYLGLLTNLETLKIELPEWGWTEIERNNNSSEELLVSQYLTSVFPTLVNLKHFKLWSLYDPFKQLSLNLFQTYGFKLESFEASLVLGRETAFLTSNQLPNLRSLELALDFEYKDEDEFEDDDNGEGGENGDNDEGEFVKYVPPKHLYKLTSLTSLKISYDRSDDYNIPDNFHDNDVINFILHIATDLEEIDLCLEAAESVLSLDNMKKLLVGFQNSLVRLSVVYSWDDYFFNDDDDVSDVPDLFTELQQLCQNDSIDLFNAGTRICKSKYFVIEGRKICHQISCH